MMRRKVVDEGCVSMFTLEASTDQVRCGRSDLRRQERDGERGDNHI